MTSIPGCSPRTATSLTRMDTDSHGLKHFEVTEKIIGIFYEVYNELGHGFLESVYEQALAIAFSEHQVFFQRQIAIPVWFHGKPVGDFRADLLVDNKVIVELKVGRAIESAWEKQLLNYLRGTEIEIGLLLNFGPSAQFRRLVFDNGRKKIRENPCKSVEKKLADPIMKEEI
jgi:GxxExxY protein